MNGKIYFDDLAQLANFLSNFTGSTAKFEVRETMNHCWVLEFLGGF